MPLGIREFKGRELNTHRSDAMEEEEVTFTDANETLRHADLFLSLVYGIGVFVRHLDI
jgi:hypothetical protein